MSNLPTKVPIHKTWEGKNMFCFKGRIIGGPAKDIPTQICVYTFILGAGGLYYGLIAKDIAKNLTIALPITFTILYLCVWVTYILTSWSDPGILPKRKYIEITPDAILRTDQQNFL